MTRVVRFSLGPVQGFIGSARRTRDLWAGSFLLSWLTGQAMAAVIESKGRITLPAVYNTAGSEIVDPILRAIIQTRTASAVPIPNRLGPLIGTLPNHFRAELGADFDVGLCRDAVLCAWQKLAQAVFDTFVAPVCSGDYAENVTDIWRWQIPPTGRDDPFWEITWVEGNDPVWKEEVHWLDRRKAWRSHMIPAETVGRDQCFMMPEFAELSGWCRSSGQRERELQDEFWETLRSHIRTVMYPRVSAADIKDAVWLKTLELRQNERLCAIALVKRLFPVLPVGCLADALGWIPAAGSASDHDAALALRNWPSTAFMSAVHWIEHAWAGGKNMDICESYATEQRRNLHAAVVLAERPQHHKIKCLDDMKSEDDRGDTVAARFSYLDGGLFFPRTLEANRYAEHMTLDERKRRAQTLIGRYDALREALGERKHPGSGASLASPWPFYALLSMDGDTLGRWVSSSRPLASAISDGLRSFSGSVLDQIREHNGITIYAGGDDVLALLPIEDAICAALSLNDAYRASLRDSTSARKDHGGFDADKHATISAGLVFADFQVPLSDVRDEARRLLEKVAKEKNGRDSIAISIYKSGGIVAEWVSSWDGELKLFMPDGRVPCKMTSPATQLFTLAKTQGKKGQSTPLASRFPYTLRSRFGDLFGGSHGLKGQEIVSLLLAEFAGSRREASRDIDPITAAELMSQVYHLCLAHRSQRSGGATSGRLSLDGLIIARFLAEKALWT